ncbi:hypothetical protein GE061_013124 [Apolygus lucorum]|uniref:Uncharacterized protein n=1 Tax=Apolygus lucorum TaxID=248454 RepID=A0A8S9XWF4_APOLU|nr:hypothetical protein GE061_013124 [Apolygus lucorum]
METSYLQLSRLSSEVLGRRLPESSWWRLRAGLLGGLLAAPTSLSSAPPDCIRSPSASFNFPSQYENEGRQFVVVSSAVTYSEKPK